MVADLRLGGDGDGACHPRAAVADEVCSCLSAGSFVFWFSALCCVFSCFSCTVCLCTAQILLEFVLARSVIFYLRVSVNEREAQI
jgi:hypothetical protein